jgi:hypothetical protein
MRLIAILLIALNFTSCYVSKPLEDEVHVRISANFPITITNTGNSTFSANLNETQYYQEFVKGLEAEFGTSNIIIDETKALYEIRFTSYTVTESTKTETVNDTTSNDHGRVFELTTLKMRATGTIVDVRTKDTFTWSAAKEKSESATSLRSGGQVVTGQNKDKKEYREKAFDDNQTSDLTTKCGRRSGVSIVKKISKALH